MIDRALLSAVTCGLLLGFGLSEPLEAAQDSPPPKNLVKIRQKPKTLTRLAWLRSKGTPSRSTISD